MNEKRLQEVGPPDDYKTNGRQRSWEEQRNTLDLDPLAAQRGVDSSARFIEDEMESNPGGRWGWSP